MRAAVDRVSLAKAEFGRGAEACGRFATFSVLRDDQTMEEPVVVRHRPAVRLRVVDLPVGWPR